MDIILNIINFVLVLGIVIFVHELGHLMAAKAFGVYCNEFALGMGPKIFSYKKPEWETTYSIRLLPIGGFVSMAGEPGEKEFNVSEERTVPGIAPWKRLVIMLAGVTMNFLLGFIIFTGIFATQGEMVQPDATINTVAVDSPAENAGLLSGDKIIKVEFFDGYSKEVNSFSDLTTLITTYGEKEVEITYLRGDVEYKTTLTPENNGERVVIGVTAMPASVQHLNFFESMGASISYIGTIISSLLFVIGRLFRGVGMNALGGPIAIFEATSEIKNVGFIYFLSLVGMFSVNLAVLNLLPIPILDGGRAFLTLVEMVIRKPLPEKFENVIMLAGAAIMITFMVFVFYNDIFKLFN